VAAFGLFWVSGGFAGSRRYGTQPSPPHRSELIFPQKVSGKSISFSNDCRHTYSVHNLIKISPFPPYLMQMVTVQALFNSIPQQTKGYKTVSSSKEFKILIYRVFCTKYGVCIQNLTDLLRTKVIIHNSLAGLPQRNCFPYRFQTMAQQRN
jgi:hypothetical protein